MKKSTDYEMQEKNTGIKNHSASKIICTHAENCRKSSLAVFRYALPELYLDYNRVMRKFRICVIDDNEIDRLRFTTLLKQVDYPVAIYSFSCVRDFLDSREKSDIVFLDIELKEEDGIGLRNSVRNNTRWIIYMTSWKERMQEAFSSNVIAFLLKQDPDIALKEMIRRLFDEYLGKVVSFRTTAGIVDIPVSEIHMITRENRKLYIYVYNEEIQVFDLTLSELIELVGNDFIQTDRSRAVNYRHVIGFEGNDFVLDNGRQERISTRRKKQVIRLFMEKRLTFGH